MFLTEFALLVSAPRFQALEGPAGPGFGLWSLQLLFLSSDFSPGGFFSDLIHSLVKNFFRTLLALLDPGLHPDSQTCDGTLVQSGRTLAAGLQLLVSAKFIPTVLLTDALRQRFEVLVLKVAWCSWTLEPLIWRNPFRAFNRTGGGSEPGQNFNHDEFRCSDLKTKRWFWFCNEFQVLPVCRRIHVCSNVSGPLWPDTGGESVHTEHAQLTVMHL